VAYFNLLSLDLGGGTEENHYKFFVFFLVVFVFSLYFLCIHCSSVSFIVVFCVLCFL
jgi:hypothetical protein